MGFLVPLGTKDLASVIAALPDDVDAIYPGGADDVVKPSVLVRQLFDRYQIGANKAKATALIE